MLLALILTVFFIIPSLRFFAKPILYSGSVICGIVLLFDIIISSYNNFKELKYTSNEDQSNFTVCSIFLTLLFGVLFILNLIFIIWMVLHRKSVNVTCKCIKETIRYDKLGFSWFWISL